MDAKRKEYAVRRFLISSLLAVALTSCSGPHCNQEQDDDMLLLLALGLQLSDPRSASIADYNASFLGTMVPSSGWTGSVVGCDAGTVPDSVTEMVGRRIAYFRRRAGVSDQVVMKADYKAKDMQAALIMKANAALSHTPPMGWTCYTADGALAASKSNLALGAHSARAMTLYMEDEGAGNTAVGHRRWILYSRGMDFGSGSTDSSNALWVVADTRPTSFTVGGFVAWPPPGFVPRQLVFPRWSLSVPDADFTNATVSMVGPDGSSITPTIEARGSGAGDNSIVWRTTAISTAEGPDRVTQVLVSNVMVSGVSRDFAYGVTVVDPPDPGGTGTAVPGVTWGTIATGISEYVSGMRATFACPAGGPANNTIWGTGRYHYQSSVCSAAVHAGRITESGGGAVTIRFRDGLAEYTGSSSNGRTSFANTPGGPTLSFEFP